MFGLMSGMWNWGNGDAREAPATEMAGDRYANPKATAPHLGSTPARRRALQRDYGNCQRCTVGFRQPYARQIISKN